MFGDKRFLGGYQSKTYEHSHLFFSLTLIATPREDRPVEPIHVGEMQEITEEGHTPQAERLGDKAGFGVIVLLIHSQ